MTTTFQFQGDFQAEVLEASHRVPILVDFWAEWCGPCRTLGPVLEKLAAEAGDRWQLVKLDTEAHPQLAAEYGIRSIPAVKLFHDGSVVDEFVGALPEAEIVGWLTTALGRLGDEGLSVRDNPLADALGLLRTDPVQAMQLAEEADGSTDPEMRRTVLTLGRLCDLSRRNAWSALGQSGGRGGYIAGAKALAEGRDEDALRHWIGVVRQDRSMDDDGARRAVIALFKLLGEESPLTQEYRRQFSAALF